MNECHAIQPPFASFLFLAGFAPRHQPVFAAGRVHLPFKSEWSCGHEIPGEDTRFGPQKPRCNAENGQSAALCSPHDRMPA